VTLMDVTGLFDTVPQAARPTLFPMSVGVGINVRVHPNGQTAITCMGGNCKGAIYTYSVASFKAGKPTTVYATSSQPQVFSQGICFNKQGTLFAVCCDGAMLVHEIATRKDKMIGSGQHVNCCFTDDGKSLVVEALKFLYQLEDVMGPAKEKWRVPMDIGVTSINVVGPVMIVGGSGVAVVIDPNDGKTTQTLPLEPRGCTGVTSFVWDTKLYLLICCDVTHQLTMWVWSAGQFVHLGVLLDLNVTTDLVVRTYVNPAHTAYLVFTSFGVMLRFRFADLVKFAEDANEGKEPTRPSPADTLRLPTTLHDAFVNPEGDGVLFVNAVRVTTYQRSIQYVSADGMNLWNV